MVAEKFQIYSVKITANTFASQKIEAVHFYSYSFKHAEVWRFFNLTINILTKKCDVPE